MINIVQGRVGWGTHTTGTTYPWAISTGDHCEPAKHGHLGEIAAEFMVLFLVVSLHLLFVSSSLVAQWQREGQGS